MARKNNQTKGKPKDQNQSQEKQQDNTQNQQAKPKKDKKAACEKCKSLNTTDFQKQSEPGVVKHGIKCLDCGERRIVKNTKIKSKLTSKPVADSGDDENKGDNDENAGNENTEDDNAGNENTSGSK